MGLPALIQEAPAKVNLYLHVTSKRSDGYHTLASLAVFARDIVDHISIEPSEQFSFSMSGPFAKTLENEDPARNLAVRAARLYSAATGKGDTVSIKLEKNIPAGAGLGGGSADAAAVIHAMEEMFGAPLPERNKNLLMLGADVPVCYHARACHFEGIGEIITDAPPVPALHILLIRPDNHCATKDIFDRREGGFSSAPNIPTLFGNIQQFIEFMSATRNDLRDAAVSMLPEIAEAEILMAQQNGCLLARMTGSGSAVYGLFERKEDCTQAQENLQAAKPLWWVKNSLIS